MFKTATYTKAKKEDYKYVFYLNKRDYYENRMPFVMELDNLIERFSEELDDKGLVVKAYDGKIANVHKEIMDKPWKPYDYNILKKTLGMLILDVNFEDFNPRKDNWIYFYFIRDQRYKINIGRNYTIREAEELFDKLVEIINRENCDLFKEIKRIRMQEKAKRAVEATKDLAIDVAKDIVKSGVINYGIGLGIDNFTKVINQIWREIN